MVMTIGSHLSVDIGPVPFTFQNAAVFLLAMTLPPGRAFLSVLIWIAWGVIGMPLFALFYSGAESISGPTGGYFLGMLIAAPLMSLLQFQWAHCWNKMFSFKKISVDHESHPLKFLPAVMAGILGSMIILFFGWGYLTLYYFSWESAFQIGIAPFLLPSIGKVIFTAGIIHLFQWAKIGA